MDEISKPIRRVITDVDVEPAPHVAGVSVVPPEHPVVDEPSKAGLLSHETSAAVGSAFNTLTQAVRKPEFADARRFGPRNSPTPAGILAGRQFARLGRTYGTDGNRADRSRALSHLYYYRDPTGWSCYFIWTVRATFHVVGCTAIFPHPKTFSHQANLPRLKSSSGKSEVRMLIARDLSREVSGSGKRPDV